MLFDILEQNWISITWLSHSHAEETYSIWTEMQDLKTGIPGRIYHKVSVDLWQHGCWGLAASGPLSCHGNHCWSMLAGAMGAIGVQGELMRYHLWLRVKVAAIQTANLFSFSITLLIKLIKTGSLAGFLYNSTSFLRIAAGLGLAKLFRVALWTRSWVVGSM